MMPKKNKRAAEIPIVLLVLGVIAVCATALVSFQISESKVQKSFINPNVFTNISVQMENFYIYVNSGMTEQQAANLVGASLDGNKLTLKGEQQGVMNVTYIVNLNKR